MEQIIGDARHQLIGTLFQDCGQENVLDEIVQTDVSLQEKLEMVDIEWIKHERINVC